MSGAVIIVGLGPGDAAKVTPEVTAALAEATDVVGYSPYVARVAPREGLTLHPSDNRVELDRATHALEMAAAGGRVVVVSSGDPGVFAMAIGFPTVARGKARIRVMNSAAHTPADLEQALAAFEKIGREMGVIG